MSFIRKPPNSPYYYYYWSENGTQKSKSLKTEDRTLADIRKGDEDRARFCAANNLPNLEKPWAEFRTEFLSQYDGRTLILYAQAISEFEAFANPSTCASVTQAQAIKFVEHLKLTPRGRKTEPGQKERAKRPPSPTTVNIFIRALRTMFNTAKEMGYLVKSPFATVKEIWVTKKHHHYLTHEQVRALLEVAKRSWCPDAYLIALLFLYTGLRRSEIVNQAWENIDLGRNLLFVREYNGWKPKDREERDIPLANGDLLEQLRRRPERTGYVCQGNGGGKRDECGIDHLFNKLYRRAGINARGVHILRHTCLTNLAAVMPLRDVQGIAGHSDIKTTEGYLHETEAGRRKIAMLNYGDSSMAIPLQVVNDSAC